MNDVKEPVENKDKKAHKPKHIRSLPEMDEQQFTQWSDLLEEKTGMRLLDNRMSFLVTNLGMRMRKLGIDDYQQYYDHVQSGQSGKVEWDQLIHHLTVHETRFLRHAGTLTLIEKECLPQQPVATNARPLTINVWSVGCSTGEEPYSIAMAIDCHLLKLQYEYYLGIIASDISRSALAVGRKGIYLERKLKNMRPSWRDVYFNKLDGGSYQISSELRQRVCFNYVNILDIGSTPITNMDIIVCQNLLIYYDQKRRHKIVSTLAEYLAPGGILILAVGEILNWKHPDMERMTFPNTLAYRHK